MTPRLALLLAGLALALEPCVQAQPVDGRDAPLKMALSNLYGEAASNTSSHVCSRRFPDGAARWSESLTAWKARHAAQLAEFRDLDNQLSAAVKAAPASALLTQEELVALRTMAVVWMLGGLAEAPDARARELCDGLRGRLDADDPKEQAVADQARQAAREILSRLRAETR
jgi:hypothetical protein